MSKEVSLEDLLVDTLKTNEFADILAHAIAMQYGEKLMDDFGNKITEALGKYVETTVKQYVDDYATDDRIKNRVRSVFNSIDKVTLLEVLKGKEWQEL